MSSAKSSLFMIAAFAAMAAFSPAKSFADNYWHGNNHNNWNNGNYNHYNPHDRVEHIRPVNGWRPGYVPPRTVIVQPHQQVIYRPVYYPVYPPVHGYYVGQRYTRFEPVPYRMARHLRPAPVGYYYTRCDDNVFLVSQRDNVITQIFSALLF